MVSTFFLRHVHHFAGEFHVVDRAVQLYGHLLKIEREGREEVKDKRHQKNSDAWRKMEGKIRRKKKGLRRAVLRYL